MKKKNRKIIKIFIILIGMITIFLCFNQNEVNASNATTYDFIPNGVNYLDPSNLKFTSTDNGYKVTTFECVRVKPKKDYIISVYDGLGEIVDMEVQFYNSDWSDGFLYKSTVLGQITKFGCDEDTTYVSIMCLIEYYDDNDLDKECNLVMYEEGVDVESLTAIDFVYRGQNEFVEISEEFNYYTNASNPISINQLNSEIMVLDDIDGDITYSKTIITDTYSDNIDKVGTWLVEYSVIDAAENENSIKINVHVLDDIAPVISGQNEYFVKQNELITVDQVKANLTATDNYLGDITDQITIVSDDYTNNETVIGAHSMIFKVSDGIQETQYVVTINVTLADEIAPVIPSDLTIEVGNNQNISIEELLSNIVITDETSTKENITIEYSNDTYTANIGKIGTYSVTITAVDEAGNIAQEDVIIKIVDKTPPLFFTFTKNIYIKAELNVVTTQDLITYLQKTNNLNPNFEYEVIYDEYTENKNTPGKYRVVFECDDIKTGVVVNVVERLYEVEEEVSFFIRIRTFFENIFIRIRNFFRWIF